LQGIHFLRLLFSLEAIKAMVVICGFRVPEIQADIGRQRPMNQIGRGFNLVREADFAWQGIRCYCAKAAF